MIQRLRFYLYFVMVAFVITSCEKELSYETGGIPDVITDSGTVSGTSKFTFNGGTAICTGAALSGTFTAGTAATASNKVVIKVTVDSTGTYAVTTSAVNGISFSGSGTFTTKGVQDITLTASGTPTTSGTFNFTTGPGGCTFSVTVNAASTGGGPAVFTLGGAGAACTGFTIGGTYISGVPASASNTASIEVNVTTIGTYAINTSAVNGISFSKSGSFTTTGTQTVVLAASGTPAIQGTNNFSVTAGGVSCSFPVTVTAPAPPATFTLAGSPGSCTPATVNGAYQSGTALTAANTITIQVNVSEAGSYNLTSNTVNGISFVASGEFTSIGIQDITLTGTGTPTAAGTFTFNPQLGTSGCTFDITVSSAPVASGTYSCKIDGVLMNFTDRAVADNFDEVLSVPELFLDGFSGPPNGGTVPEFQIFITMNDGTLAKVGTYDEKGLAQINGYQIAVSYIATDDPSEVIIWNTGSNFLSTNPPFTITITSITSTRVKGTFSGQLKHTLVPSDTRIRTVTEGVFDLPIQ